MIPPPNKRKLLFAPGHQFFENLFPEQRWRGNYVKLYFIPCAKFFLHDKMLVVKNNSFPVKIYEDELYVLVTYISSDS